MLIKGSCHCGNVAFTLHWQPEPVEIAARACGCTFCRKHGGVWTSCPTGRLHIQVADGRRMHRYRFGTRTADFHVCSTCGAVPVVTSEIAGKTYAVVNVNAFDDVDSSMIRRSPADFDGEDEADRLARRVRRWIGDVTFADTPA